MKFVQEYCSICKQEVAMPVVQEDEGHPGLVWVRCPLCREIKPLEAQEEAPAPKPGPGKAPARETTPRRVVRHYRAGERFSPGEWIYHSEWDDTGQVIEKCHSRGGHEVIVVAFEKIGTKRLVSNFAR